MYNFILDLVTNLPFQFFQTSDYLGKPWVTIDELVDGYTFDHFSVKINEQKNILLKDC